MNLKDPPIPNKNDLKPFLQGMLDRLGVSGQKYGPMKDAYPHKVDALACLRERLRRYERDGNTEWLMDVANFALIEFLFPSHNDAHYRPTDSDESPGLVQHDGGRQHGRHD